MERYLHDVYLESHHQPRGLSISIIEQQLHVDTGVGRSTLHELAEGGVCISINRRKRKNSSLHRHERTSHEAQVPRRPDRLSLLLWWLLWRPRDKRGHVALLANTACVGNGEDGQATLRVQEDEGAHVALSVTTTPCSRRSRDGLLARPNAVHKHAGECVWMEGSVSC
jgi:hypothetical protein